MTVYEPGVFKKLNQYLFAYFKVYLCTFANAYPIVCTIMFPIRTGKVPYDRGTEAICSSQVFTGYSFLFYITCKASSPNLCHQLKPLSQMVSYYTNTYIYLYS